ncbi:MAG: peptidyl-tRNA hydrolase Pth2 [Candidatus Thorarchaeota archaeon]|nr:peptidyl-tRNA hydrolase Pth2 [Candidatus Thorarchaeota archaeon]
MTNQYKQVMAVRTDLGMSVGKIAVQTAHGAVSAAEAARKKSPDAWKAWLNGGQKKITVQVDSMDALIDLKNQANSYNISHYLVRDAGMTQLSPGTATVLGIGPAPNHDIDKITGSLKLL